MHTRIHTHTHFDARDGVKETDAHPTIDDLLDNDFYFDGAGDVMGEVMLIYLAKVVPISTSYLSF